jgi:hypothetical protein
VSDRSTSSTDLGLLLSRMAAARRAIGKRSGSRPAPTAARAGGLSSLRLGSETAGGRSTQELRILTAECRMAELRILTAECRMTAISAVPGRCQWVRRRGLQQDFARPAWTGTLVCSDEMLEQSESRGAS